MSQIALNDTYTRIRGGGYGTDAWIARITGLDEKFGLKREFCYKHKHLSGTGRSGYIEFTVTEPGVYEFRKFCKGSTARNWEWSGYVELAGDGTSTTLTREEVTERLKTTS